MNERVSEVFLSGFNRVAPVPGVAAKARTTSARLGRRYTQSPTFEQRCLNLHTGPVEMMVPCGWGRSDVALARRYRACNSFQP